MKDSFAADTDDVTIHYRDISSILKQNGVIAGNFRGWKTVTTVNVDYPFCPKSTSRLVSGQFWPIELTNGRFASGRVLQLKFLSGAQDRRMFLAGLMDWCGEAPPTSHSLDGAGLLEFGQAHTSMFSSNGFQVTGYRPLENNSLEIPLALDSLPSRYTRVVRGFETVGLATPDQHSLPVFSTWGMSVIVLLAQKYFVTR